MQNDTTADGKPLVHVWPSNLPQPETNKEADWAKLGADIGISLDNDATEETRLQDNHDRSMQSMVVEQDQLDPSARKLIDEYRAKNGHQDVDNPGWLAKTLDVPAQAANGFTRAVNSMKDLVFDAGAEGAQLLYADGLGVASRDDVADEASKLKENWGKDVPMPFGDPKGLPGQITQPVAQFLAPFAAVSKIKYLQALGKAAPLAKGVIADFVGFGEHEQRLSNMIESVPALKNPVTAYLAADPNDGWAEGRFKNSLEGAGLGMVTDAVFHGVRYMKDAQAARKTVAEMRATAEPRAQEIRTAAGMMGQARDWIGKTLRGEDAGVAPSVAQAAPEPAAAAASAPRLAATDRDTAIRTIFGEASNQGEAGWQAVANVLLNRQQAGKYGKTLDAIAKKKNQFEPWGNDAARARMEALDPNSAEYKAIGDVFDRVAKGDLPDNTGGATHFLQRQLQENLGRKVPKWAQNALGKIGDHEFFSPDGNPITGRQALISQAPDGAETMAGFRPNREQIDLATQRRMAAANGLTEDELKGGKVFNKLREMGVQDELNKVTMLEAHQLNRTRSAVGDYLKRADVGDASAADDFWRNEGAAFIEVAGAARDAFQDVARAQGMRGNTPEVVTTNEILRRLAGATSESKEDLMRAFAEISQPEQMESLMQQLGRKGKLDITRDVVHEWYINAILSSPKTQLVDTAGTLIWTPWLALEKIPAGVAGAIRAGWLGGAADRVMADESLVMLKSYFGSVADGLSFVGKAMKGPNTLQALRDGINDVRLDAATRFDDDTMARAISSENFGLERDSGFGRMVDWAGSAINMPGAFMRTKDDIAKAVLYRAEVRALAHRRATGEGLSGAAYDARINQLMAVPMDKASIKDQSLSKNRLSQIANGLATGDDAGLFGAAIEDQAKAYAREGTFTDELGEVGKSMQNLLNRIPGGRVMVPFIKTPTKVMVQFLNRTPLAPVLFKKVRDDLAAGGARADMAIGRMAAGSSVMSLGWYLASAGLITGEGPKDAGQREALLRTGWRPRSIKVGEKYIEYGRLDPLASFLSMPANVVDLMDQLDNDPGALHRDLSDYVGVGILGFTNMMMSKTWTQSVAELVDAVNRQDENGVQRMMQYYAASAVVPNAVTFFGNEVNPIVQQANGMWEAIQVKAGLTVRPKLDIFGETVKRDPQLYYGLPASYANITHDPLAQKLAMGGVFIERPDRRIEGVELTPDEYSSLMSEMKTLGVKDAMKTLVNSPLWDTLPDAVKTGEDGAQDVTKSGVASNLYRQYLKAAREITVSKNATLQQRILRYKQALQTDSATPPNVERALNAQGLQSGAGPIRADFGLGRAQ